MPPISDSRGLWAQTASIDWCETNYEFSYYIAEFWNTLSNFAFILPQLYQYIALSRHEDVVEPAFRKAFLSLILVGIGSLCFHMTLAKPMQMFDETSMILVSLHGFYLLYLIREPNVNKRILTALLICYGLMFLSLYVFLVSWPIFHHTTFGLLVYASVAVGYQLKLRYGPHYKFWTVLIMQHLGFGFWLIDKHYCELLTQFRDNNVPAIVRPFFQFHALWHVLMGLGSHTFICGLVRLRAWTNYGENFVIRFRWFGLWLTLERTTSQKRYTTDQKRDLHHSCDYSGEGDSPLKSTKPKQIQQVDLNRNEVQFYEDNYYNGNNNNNIVSKKSI